MMTNNILEIPIKGMDCAGCASSVQKAIAGLPGVQSVDVLLNAEKARIQFENEALDLGTLRRAVEAAGYSVPETETVASAPKESLEFSKSIWILFGLIFGAVLFLALAGEGLGLFEIISQIIPFPIGLIIVLIAGYPIFRNVVRATLRREVISHTLMSIGVIAALVIGQWVTAAIIVFFMRLGEFAERFTTERSRQAMKNLTAMAPLTARVERAGEELELAISEVHAGDLVIVRPGEKISVDGEVISGQALVDQATITGESMPVEIIAGSKVFAATFAQLGSLRIRATGVGSDTTFGHVLRLVEEAETNRADVQRMADKFSGYFLPIVATIAALTFLISRNPLSTAAVLVVACSCSLALATPIAMLASIGAAAKNGLLIKGGKYIETLARADLVLLDKTGTLTLGQPYLTEIISLTSSSEAELLSLAASAEKYSEHPLAEAVRLAAKERKVALYEPKQFEAIPGFGVKAEVNGHSIVVGNQRFLKGSDGIELAAKLEAEGKTVLFVQKDGEILGLLAAADRLRPEIPEAIEALRTLGLKDIQILTGDNERVAASLAQELGVNYQANLLPEDKIKIVREFQEQGRIVVMIGDGVNDAPALAQANVGIAMAAAGSDVAIDAAHIALMREDWTLVPEVFRIAQRTMRVVKMNIAFTALYNLIGLSLAAFGILPPVLAAAAQSLPDLGILANSSRLLRYERAAEKRPMFEPKIEFEGLGKMAETTCDGDCCSSQAETSIVTKSASPIISLTEIQIK
jgi:Cu+-exporting ATPase